MDLTHCKITTEGLPEGWRIAQDYCGDITRMMPYELYLHDVLIARGTEWPKNGGKWSVTWCVTDDIRPVAEKIMADFREFEEESERKERATLAENARRTVAEWLSSNAAKGWN